MEERLKFLIKYFLNVLHSDFDVLNKIENKLKQLIVSAESIFP